MGYSNRSVVQDPRRAGSIKYQDVAASTRYSGSPVLARSIANDWFCCDCASRISIDSLWSFVELVNGPSQLRIVNAISASSLVDDRGRKERPGVCGCAGGLSSTICWWSRAGTKLPPSADSCAPRRLTDCQDALSCAARMQRVWPLPTRAATFWVNSDMQSTAPVLCGLVFTLATTTGSAQQSLPRSDPESQGVSSPALLELTNCLDE